MQVFVKPRGHKFLHKLDQVHCLSTQCSLSYPVCYIQHVCIIVISLRGISCLFIQPWSFDHFEGQRFNLIWSNVNKKFSILPLTRFVLHQCTTPFDIFKHVKYHKKKSKSKTYNTVGTVTKHNTKIVERCKIFNPNTQIHDRSLSWVTRQYSLVIFMLFVQSLVFG